MTRRHLLVTNDFPPKVGGIQNYLWELWRRLDPNLVSVITTPYRGAAAFDGRQTYPVTRSPEPWLGPWPWLLERIRRRADQMNADLVLFDPAFPLGAIAPYLGRPYGLVLHGAEVTIPARLPVTSRFMAATLRGASLVVSAGQYALTEAERCAQVSLPSVVIPPGVDSVRFRPLDADRRLAVRRKLGIEPSDVLVSSVSRLVPRKGMATLIEAVAEANGANPELSLRLIIGGSGREADGLKRVASRTHSPAVLAGRLSDVEVAELYGASDLMAMLCHERLGGLEQEGFGIVFLEAAASGIAQVAGRSGGAHEAVVHGETGLIVDDPRSVGAAASALVELAHDPTRRMEMGRRARERAKRDFDYATLAHRLQTAVDSVELRNPGSA